MNAKELFEKVKVKFDSYNPIVAKREIDQMEERGRRDVLDRENWGYYQFLACLVEDLKPAQVVELGGAMGVGSLMILSSLPLQSKLYSVTLEEGGLEFSYIKEEYPNFVPIVGNDLDLSIWERSITPPAKFDPKVLLEQTDIWFFDSLHTTEQLTKELELYSPFFKKSTVLLFDDIKMPELWPVWVNLPHDKFDASILHQPSGFGIAIVT